MISNSVREVVDGQVGGSYNEQYLKYRFLSDQTVPKDIITSFRRMLPANATGECDR